MSRLNCEGFLSGLFIDYYLLTLTLSLDKFSSIQSISYISFHSLAHMDVHSFTVAWNLILPYQQVPQDWDWTCVIWRGTEMTGHPSNRSAATSTPCVFLACSPPRCSGSSPLPPSCRKIVQKPHSDKKKTLNKGMLSHWKHESSVSPLHSTPPSRNESTLWISHIHSASDKTSEGATRQISPKSNLSQFSFEHLCSLSLDAYLVMLCS